MPTGKQSKPVIPPSKRRPRGTEPTATFVASLARPAPLTLLCMACRTPRCADTDRIVLWHRTPQDDGECAGAGAPGLDWNPVRRGWQDIAADREDEIAFLATRAGDH